MQTQYWSGRKLVCNLQCNPLWGRRSAALASGSIPPGVCIICRCWNAHTKFDNGVHSILHWGREVQCCCVFVFTLSRILLCCCCCCCIEYCGEMALIARIHSRTYTHACALILCGNNKSGLCCVAKITGNFTDFVISIRNSTLRQATTFFMFWCRSVVLRSD